MTREQVAPGFDQMLFGSLRLQLGSMLNEVGSLRTWMVGHNCATFDVLRDETDGANHPTTVSVLHCPGIPWVHQRASLWIVRTRKTT